MARYTTVKEMSDKVNELYDLLAKAKNISRELFVDNARNSFVLKYESYLAGESRPLTMEERIKEADDYRRAFRTLMQMIESAENFIGANY